MAGAGVFFGLVGFIFLMLSLTYLLNKWVEMWIAAGIVGLVLAIVAAMLVMNGKSQIADANLKPNKTIESVKEDKEWASRQMKSVKN
jgi:vacuolar-type H+-ATPase subunit I/STV1